MSDASRVLLKKIRGHLGLTQADLARKMGVAMRTVSRWEVGTSEMPATALPQALALLRAHNPDLADRIGIGAGLPSVVAQEEARREALDHAVYVAADALDISPKRARAVLATFLTHLVAAGLTPSDARARLVERARGDAAASGDVKNEASAAPKK